MCVNGTAHTNHRAGSTPRAPQTISGLKVYYLVLKFNLWLWTLVEISRNTEWLQYDMKCCSLTSYHYTENKMHRGRVTSTSRPADRCSSQTSGYYFRTPWGHFLSAFVTSEEENWGCFQTFFVAAKSQQKTTDLIWDILTITSQKKKTLTQRRGASWLSFFKVLEVVKDKVFYTKSIIFSNCRSFKTSGYHEQHSELTHGCKCSTNAILLLL